MFKQLITVLFLTIPLYTFAQTGITGGVFDYDNKSFPLQKVTVRNLNNKETTFTGAAGQFMIKANKGDLLEFSLPGYHTDTLYLTNMLSKTIYLPASSTTLKQVDIQSAKLSRDLKLRDAKAKGFERVHGISPTQNIQRAGGIGLAFGSGKVRRERAKEKALEEKGAYEAEISKYFNEEYVSSLIKLQGQELKEFIELYRPTVERVKAEDPFNYDYYIAVAYQTWLKLPPEQRRLPSMKKPDKN